LVEKLYPVLVQGGFQMKVSRFYQLNASVIIGIVSFLLHYSAFAQTSQTDQEKQIQYYKHKFQLLQKMLANEKQTTPNQQDFDAQYYSLDLNIDPTAKTIDGKVNIVCQVIAQSLSKLELDLWDGLTISSIYMKGNPGDQLSYTLGDDLLAIELGAEFLQGQLIDVVVEYSGSPQNSPYESFGFDSHNGTPMIWTLSQPFGARAWWPCKDVPSDKADSVDIRITVPGNLIVASNGALIDKTTQGDFTTFHWKEKYPIATYLVSLAIYSYKVSYDDYLYNNGEDTMKIHFYMFPDHADKFAQVNSKTKEMLAFLSGLFGEYPFVDEKYGHAEFTRDDWAMEHQTCSSFGERLLDERTVVHELAHQWWGDMITCENFHHIWLNEGFATYSEILWEDHINPGTANSLMMKNRYLYLGPGSVFMEDVNSLDVFAEKYELIYEKGPWIVHMLRHVVGDSTFFEILRTYYGSRHQYGTSLIEDFQATCEQTAGKDLNKFFQQWIYGEYHPVYAYGWSIKAGENGYDVKLRIDQVQENTGVFWMPVDVKITMNSYDTVFVAMDSMQTQNFTFSITDSLVNIELDSDNWILKEIDEQSVLPYPHAQNIVLNNSFQNPDMDTLKITSAAANPENHDIEMSAIIESFDSSVTETIALFDDGMHSDGSANDGVFGHSWVVPSSEQSYNVHIKTTSSNTGYSNIFHNAS